MVETDKDDTLHTMSFNQDGGCLSVGTGSGFRICNVHPFVETIRRKLDGVGGGELSVCFVLQKLVFQYGGSRSLMNFTCCILL